MAKKPDNAPVIAETRRANAAAEANAAENIALVKKQMSLMASQKAPKYDPPAPGPTQSSADVIAAGVEARRRSARLYGHNQSMKLNHV